MEWATLQFGLFTETDQKCFLQHFIIIIIGAFKDDTPPWFFFFSFSFFGYDKNFLLSLKKIGWQKNNALHLAQKKNLTRSLIVKK